MLRILVVDDHRNTRESLALGLSLHDCDAQTAASAEEALRLVEHRVYDCAVCDVRMPDASGLELARLLHARHPHLGLVLMTAHHLTDAENAAAAALGATLVIKPITAEALTGHCLTACAPGGAARHLTE